MRRIVRFSSMGRGGRLKPAGVLSDYWKFMAIQTDPQTVLDKYRIDYCLIAQEEPIVQVMPLVLGWKKIYADERSVIYARRD